MTEPMAARLRRGERLAGTMVRVIAEPAAALLAKEAGLDLVIIDMEHGPFTFAQLESWAGTARAVGLGVIVRVPELARGYVSRALDCGADGVMVPMLETVAQARALAAWAKYPPVGGRGLSSFGAHTGYRAGANGSRFMAESNTATLAVAQIETSKAIENIEAIASEEGVDALLVGPNDLAVSLGCIDDPAAPAREQAIERVAAAAAKHGKVFGMHADLKMLQRWSARGLNLAVSGIDSRLMADAFRGVAESVRAL